MQVSLTVSKSIHQAEAITYVAHVFNLYHRKSKQNVTLQ